MNEALNEDSDRAEAVRKQEDTEELIRRFGQGDQEAFEAFHGIFFPRLAHHYFPWYSRDATSAWAARERAEDKANDMLFSAYCKADHYRPGTDVWRWLLTFGRTRMAWVGKQAKTRYFMGAGSEDSLDSEHPCLAWEPKPVPVSSLPRNISRDVNIALALMNPRQAKALRLFTNSNGFAMRELCACLGRADDKSTPIKRGTFQKTVERALKSFCKHYSALIGTEKALADMAL